MRLHILKVELFKLTSYGLTVARGGFLLLWIFLCTHPLQAQQTDIAPAVDRQTVEMLLKRIEQLESTDKQLEERVAQLEQAQQRPLLASAIQPAVSVEKVKTAPEVIPAAAVKSSVGLGNQPEGHTSTQSATVGDENEDDSKSPLSIRGFGDFSFHGTTQKGTTTSFSLGQIDFFITSNISDRFRFVSDLVFEKGEGNDYEEDFERVLLEYRYNDHFKLALGRYHTAIGYYNLAFRHSSWFQTATGRPFLFLFEDEGGILPTHSVGASASGTIPSGDLGLHYIAEVGSGRSGTPGAEQVQNFVDENSHKSVDFNIFSRPEGIPGLQVGFSAYYDVLSRPNLSKVGETDLNTYVVLDRSRFEWLNEGVLIRHAPQGSPHVFNTAGFYTQFSEKFGSFQPYFRYQYVNAPNNEPIFYPIYNVSVGLQHGPSAGVRYDFSESVAVKLQYDYNNLRRQQPPTQQSISQLALQVSFAF